MSGKSDQRDLLVETECGTVQGVVAHGMGFAGRHGCQTASKFGSDSISMKFTDGNRAVVQKESAPCQSIFGFLLSSPWV